MAAAQERIRLVVNTELHIIAEAREGPVDIGCRLSMIHTMTRVSRSKNHGFLQAIAGRYSILQSKNCKPYRQGQMYRDAAISFQCRYP